MMVGVVVSVNFDGEVRYVCKTISLLAFVLEKKYERRV